MRCSARSSARAWAFEFFAVDGGQLSDAIAQLLLDLLFQVSRRLTSGLQQSAKPPADLTKQIPITHFCSLPHKTPILAPATPSMGTDR